VKARLVATVAVAVAVAALAGCGTDRSDGSSVTKITEYTEPSTSTSRPTQTTPSTTTTTTTTSPTSTPSTTMSPPPGAEELPTENGYAFFQTKSGRTRCQISVTEVGCEAQFTAPPEVDGVPANGVRLTPDGQTRWLVGNLGDIPAVTLDYRTYWTQGWTIEASEDGTRITNDRTRHGMTVAVEKVETF
jgi:hypothetical protein